MCKVRLSGTSLTKANHRNRRKKERDDGQKRRKLKRSVMRFVLEAALNSLRKTDILPHQAPADEVSRNR